MKNIVRYRKFLGFTQGDISKKLNISIQAYRNKEAERTAFKDSEKIEIKKLFNENGLDDLTIDDIFFDDKVSKSFVRKGG